MDKVQIAMKILDVTEEKAIELLDRGLDVDFLLNGYKKKVEEELGQISDDFKKGVDDIIKDEEY